MVEEKKKKRRRRTEMGLPSMPSASEAFFPVLLVALVLLPLSLLKDGIRWLVLQVMLGYDDGDCDRVEGPLDQEMETSREGWKRSRGVRLRSFKSLHYDGGRDESCCCCVCLHGFDGEEEVSQVLSCRHLFHPGCLDGWLNLMHTTCPLCRSSI